MSTETTESRTSLYPDEQVCENYSHIACPVTHGLVPVIPINTPENEGSSDYETSSTISSSPSIIERSLPRQRAILGINYMQFRRAIKIKRVFIPAKLSYFFFYIARSLFAAYFMLFLTSTGLNPEQAGSIQGVRNMVITMSALFWGFLVDKSKKDILILCIKFIGFAVIVFMKPWVAYWITRPESDEIHRQHIKEAVIHTLKQLNSTQNLDDIMKHSDDVIIEKFGLTWSAKHYETGSVPLYVMMLLLGIGSAFAGGALHVLLDVKVQQMTKQFSTSTSAFGRQRLWGSVAYSVGPLICGAVLESVPKSTVSEYMPVFYLHMVTMMLGLTSCIVLYKQKPKQKVPSGSENVEERKHIKEEPLNYEPLGKLIIRMMKSVHMVTFFFKVFSIGFANALQWSFQFIHMEELGVSKTFMGFCSLTQCSMESILFPVASKIVKRIGGNEVAHTFCVISYFLLFSMFALCENAKLFPLATACVGFGFTLYFTATMDELYNVGNPICRTSLYALYNSIMIGLGSSFAGILGGNIYKRYGGRGMYFMSALLYLMLTFLYLTYAFLYKKSFIKKWDTNYVYTQFNNSATYKVKQTTGNDRTISANSDDAISLTMEGETSV